MSETLELQYMRSWYVPKQFQPPSHQLPKMHIFVFCIVGVQYLFAELTKRDVSGFAIGGLSGGEEKSLFWRMVDISTDHLPADKPRYLMGVGYVFQRLNLPTFKHSYLMYVCMCFKNYFQ